MTIHFSKHKKDILSKPDKSQKGCMDAKIKTLCALINSHPDFVTLSSCSGRIAFLKLAKENNKKLSSWLLITHDLAQVDAFQHALNTYQGKEPLYFKQEGAILHVCTKTQQTAEKLLTLAQQAGFKHSGIIATGKKIVVEIRSAENLTAPIFDKKLLISGTYLQYLIMLANSKLERTWQQIKKLETTFS